MTKTTRAYQQVEISKRLVSETKTIFDSVRREEADIKAPENVRVLDEDKLT